MDNAEIIRRTKDLLCRYHIGLMYFGGSIAYGVATDKSDQDVIVIVKEDIGIHKVDIDEVDLFVYGYQSFMDRQSLSSKITGYHLLFIDDYLSMPRTLIYLDDTFKTEYESIIGFDIRSVLKEWTGIVYDYFRTFYELEKGINKRMYHVFRIKAFIENYKQNHTYSLSLPKEVESIVVQYKESWTLTGGLSIPYFIECLEYLRTFSEEGE